MTQLLEYIQVSALSFSAGEDASAIFLLQFQLLEMICKYSRQLHKTCRLLLRQESGSFKMCSQVVLR